jgi:adenylate kinase
MTGRRSCPKCGAVYHVVNLKPKKDGQCDRGCGPLVQRKDDTPEVVSNRLKTYHEQTAAVLGYYQRHRGRILEIQAERPIDTVTEAVFKALETVTV